MGRDVLGQKGSYKGGFQGRLESELWQAQIGWADRSGCQGRRSPEGGESGYNSIHSSADLVLGPNDDGSIEAQCASSGAYTPSPQKTEHTPSGPATPGGRA